MPRLFAGASDRSVQGTDDESRDGELSSKGGGGSSSSMEGLEVVCSVQPRFTPAPGPAAIVEAVGTAIKEVSSKIRLMELAEGVVAAATTRRRDGPPRVRTLPAMFAQPSPHRRRGACRRAATVETQRGLGSTLPMRRSNSQQDLTNRSSPVAAEEAHEEEEEDLHPTMKDLGLPGLLSRRCISKSGSGLRPGTPFASGVSFARLSSKRSSMLRDESDAYGNLGTTDLEELGLDNRKSILDFEHLFVQYFVEVRPKGRWWSWSWWRKGARSVTTMPSAKEIADGWKAEAVDYILEHRAVCQEHWPQLQMSRSALRKQMDKELSWDDGLFDEKSRVVLTCEPERICHRLFWAIGDMVSPARALSEAQKRLGRRWPHCNIRCVDGLFNPPGFFRTLLLGTSLFTLLSLRAAAHAFWNVWVLSVAPPPKVPSWWQAVPSKPSPSLPTREERLDQLAARLLLAGAMLQLWVLHTIAAAFPLRSLHSPFKRDLGCLAAYSSFALNMMRFLGPVAAMSLPMAMAIRFDRLGLALLVPAVGRPVGFHTAALCGAACLPVLTGMAAWSVRSSLYSQHHLFMVLVFYGHMATVLGFAAYFELVKWAVLSAGFWVACAFWLFTRYATEFTSVSLLKAAQLQWACAHMMPVMTLLLAAALEVESGVARALVDLICEMQEVIPLRMCIRLLRNA